MYIQRVQQYSKLNRIQTHFEVAVMKYKMMEEKCKIKVINCQGERNTLTKREVLLPLPHWTPFLLLSNG